MKNDVQTMKYIILENWLDVLFARHKNVNCFLWVPIIHILYKFKPFIIQIVLMWTITVTIILITNSDYMITRYVFYIPQGVTEITDKFNFN